MCEFAVSIPIFISTYPTSGASSDTVYLHYAIATSGACAGGGGGDGQRMTPRDLERLCVDCALLRYR
jgi:hypothetical protein